ncbi:MULTISPECIES: hypothetical protein [Cryobacterium]|uniref:hypothetical protein n=1 Tax=Cryobacterium TaxID=69578 RepID=UPI000CD41A9E|nr:MULTISPECIES: hypothetical protein [Cryobacterium]POH66065.1 hypothetical protein C3B60_09570 [Cryobacterium zongtaii]TFC46732.1 hypothetical protein E3O57_05710 [Cryobacterium sp. TMN-39-2]
MFDPLVQGVGIRFAAVHAILELQLEGDHRATTIRTATAAASGLIALALLTSCTTGGASLLPDTAPTPQATATASAPIEGDSNGDGKLSEFEKQVLTRNAPRDITLHDGTVIVTPGRPLPQPVIDQIAADAAPGAAQAQTDDEFAPMAGIRSMPEVASSYADELGRTVDIVYGGGVWDTISSVDESGGTELAGTSDQEAMVTAATDWAESHDAYTVVVE